MVGVRVRVSFRVRFRVRVRGRGRGRVRIRVRVRVRGRVGVVGYEADSSTSKTKACYRTAERHNEQRIASHSFMERSHRSDFLQIQI